MNPWSHPRLVAGVKAEVGLSARLRVEQIASLTVESRRPLQFWEQRSTVLARRGRERSFALGPGFRRGDEVQSEESLVGHESLCANMDETPPVV